MKLTQELLNRLQAGERLSAPELAALLNAQGKACDLIYQAADALRLRTMGQVVHLRGIIEFSNVCKNHCWYCGIRCDNTQVGRYRMSPEEILDVAHRAKKWGCGTVVLQSGEDPFFTAGLLSDIVGRIKNETGLAVTLSVGVRSRDELAQIKAAGCDRYLLRFETTSNALFSAIHPDESFEHRVQCLTDLRELGYQVGSGFMIGLPGSTAEMIANDILFATGLKLDMIGCGPFLAHPDTPLAGKPLLEDRGMYYKAIALLRLLNPRAHIPATTAFDALDPEGRNLVLKRGANVFMPNLTPGRYRKQYQLYPNKPCVDEEGEDCALCVRGRLFALGRELGTGPGHSEVVRTER
ncbi:MAG TPA: [FeFe] hydrogenase H-cluster radical SAM maturase HydE [Kiritimatiellia bacterium]|nr:[FeFe] hydrogenase H-cluster radical SAM maturase HydE [Kiritimatiellia bacterium]HRU70325.1 [FeFe] hydrogenase H-cluster radical SAM maturase HydE [Kiritimatiellia bacterium]